MVKIQDSFSWTLGLALLCLCALLKFWLQPNASAMFIFDTQIFFLYLIVICKSDTLINWSCYIFFLFTDLFCYDYLERVKIQSPSSSTNKQWAYDVFLSFRGEDTRKGFTENFIKLYVEKELTLS